MAYVDFLNNEDTIKMIRYGGDEYSEVSPVTGGFVPKDSERFKTEVSYNGDFHMTASKILDPFNDILPLDPNDPLQKRAIDIIIAAERAYLDPGIRHVQLTNYPPLSQELTLIQASIGTQMDDLYVKAILSGRDYSAEQAVADAKKIFTDNGGDKLTAYYAEYFRNNPKAIVTDDQMAKMLPDYLK